jgi:hypothetical protein
MSRLLLNAKVHYQVLKISPLGATLSSFNPFRKLTTILRSTSVVSFHLRKGYPSSIFLQASYAFLIYQVYSEPADLITFHLITLIIFVIVLYYGASHCAAFSLFLLISPFSVQIFPSAFCSQTSSVCDIERPVSIQQVKLSFLSINI